MCPKIIRRLIIYLPIYPFKKHICNLVIHKFLRIFCQYLKSRLVISAFHLFYFCKNNHRIQGFTQSLCTSNTGTRKPKKGRL